MARPQSVDRDAVLDAAEALVAEAGAGRLSLDLLAARTGASKGGLQYAFGGKPGLLRALVARAVEADRAATEAALAPGLPGPERLRAWIAARAALRPSRHHHALLAAAADDPALLADAPAAFRAEVARVAGRDLAPDVVMAAALAVDGLLLTGVLGLAALTEAEREAVLERVTAAALAAAGGGP